MPATDASRPLTVVTRASNPESCGEDAGSVKKLGTATYVVMITTGTSPPVPPGLGEGRAVWLCATVCVCVNGDNDVVGLTLAFVRPGRICHEANE
jgi:hypothetical protein